MESPILLESETDLIAAAMALGAASIPGFSAQEAALAEDLTGLPDQSMDRLRRAIVEGRDPLGEAFGRIRPPDFRRRSGAIYTPGPIIRSMVSWAARQQDPARVVDPGCGSGRFLLRFGERLPGAELVGVEIDPLAALTARANLAVRGLRDRSRVLLADYRDADLGTVTGRTLFIGNPPYVRHHRIEPPWKEWLAREARRLRAPYSRLAGLHLYFFLATLHHGKPGDFGAFITAAEWLDVNYGKLLRELLLGELGGKRIVVLEPTAQPFADAATTAAITTFEIAAQPTSVFFRRADSLAALGTLEGGRRIRRERLENAGRWSHFTRVVKPVPKDFVELGELCRVHRGQVTGANRVWIANGSAEDLPRTVLFRTITRARELFEAGPVLNDADPLRQVIDLPVDLSVFDTAERRAIDRFLRHARQAGAHDTYVARHRKAWWSVGLRDPAPILATYMARRPPAFVRNLADARHINIAHGLYPREPLSDEILALMARYLSRAVDTGSGRTYAGGLTKFEPREMERIPVPRPDALLDYEEAKPA